MRRFVAPAWFPVVVCVVLVAITAAALAVLAPTGEDVGNDQILTAVKIAGWAIGPVAGLTSLLLVGILNLVRRLIKLRRVDALHGVTVFLGVLPWLCFAWAVTGEPRYTPIARGVIDFVARPLLWGTLSATLLIILVAVVSAFASRSPARS